KGHRITPVCGGWKTEEESSEGHCWKDKALALHPAPTSLNSFCVHFVKISPVRELGGRPVKRSITLLFAASTALYAQDAVSDVQAPSADALPPAVLAAEV